MAVCEELLGVVYKSQAAQKRLAKILPTLYRLVFSVGKTNVGHPDPFLNENGVNSRC